MNIPPNQRCHTSYPTSSCMNYAVHVHWEIRKDDTVKPVYLCASHKHKASRFETEEEAIAHLIARKLK
jgi:hypothetical protein